MFGIGRRLERRLFRLVFGAVVKRAAQSCVLVKVSAVSRLRLFFELPLQGDDASLDAELAQLVDAFFDEGSAADLPVGNHDMEGVADWLAEDRLSTEDRRFYLRLQHWLKDGIDEARCTEISSLYRALYGEELEEVANSEIIAEYNLLLKRVRVGGEQLRESRASDLDLSQDVVRYYIPWFSVLFFVSAYVHTRLVYSHFGVHVGHFFSINDYLAVSVDQLQRALAMAVVSCAGALYAERTSTMRSRTEKEQREASGGRIDTLVRLVPVAAYVIGYFTDNVRHWPWLPLVVLAFFSVPIGRVAHRYLGGNVRALILGFTIVVFGSSAVATAWDRIREVESGESRVEVKANVALGQLGKIYDGRNSTVLGLNSRYAFFVSRRGHVEIVPLNQVQRIEVFPER